MTLRLGLYLLFCNHFKKMAPSKILKNYGHRQLLVSTFSWRINDIFTIILRNQKIHLVSPVFSTDNDNTHRWALQLIIDNNTDKPVFKLHLISNTNAHMALNSFTFHIYCNDNCIVVKEMQKSEFSNSGSFNGVCLDRKPITALKNSMTIDSKLVIDCTLSNPHIRSTESTEFYETPFKILDDYELLFLNKNHSDVTLIADGKEFPAHKAILTTRSSVFSAMFDHVKKEKHTDVANIEGIKPEVLQELLRFIYIGKIEKLGILYKELLVAADMCCIEALKTACLSYMFKIINIENSIDFLLFTDKYICDKLKDLTINFIVKNAKEIVKTKNFENLSSLNAPLVVELFERLALIETN